MKIRYAIVAILITGCASFNLYKETDIAFVRKVVLNKLEMKYKEAIPINAKGIHSSCGKNVKGEIKGDFNGDGVEDLAMLVRIGWTSKDEHGDNYKYRFLVILSDEKKGFREYNLDEDYDAHFPVGITLFLQKPAKIEETEAVDNPKTLTVKNPSIGISYCEMAVHVFYWDDKTKDFKLLVIAD